MERVRSYKNHLLASRANRRTYMDQVSKEINFFQKLVKGLILWK